MYDCLVEAWCVCVCVCVSAASITQLSGGECLPPYARTVSHVTSVPYNDAATYKDLARYIYIYIYIYIV